MHQWNKHFRSHLGIVLLALGLSLPSQAKEFSNAYLSFELPDAWQCHLEGTEWVCSSLQKNNSKEAIIVFTAKEVGPKDRLDAYEAHLRTPKTIPNIKGKPVQSIIKSVRNRIIDGHTWVDALHLNSEIPNYYTRYLATVKNQTAILITFSAHQKAFTKYSPDFVKAVESLKVRAGKELQQPSSSSSAPTQAEMLGNPTAPPALVEPTEELPTASSEGTGEGMEKWIAILALAGVLIGYFLLKKNKKN